MDYYEILQVHPRADAEAIKAAYARLCERYDPARLDGAADELVALARRKREALDQAYAVLSDPARRTAFDATLAAPTDGRASAPTDGRVSAPTDAPAAPAPPVDARELDYRPLPPAQRAERPRGFDTQPLRPATRPGRATRARAPRLSPPLVFGVLLALVVTFSLGLTGWGGPPPAAPSADAPTAVPTISPLDQFEAQIAETQRAAEQNPSSAQAWIDYGNTLYNSAEIVRENEPDSDLYRQRLPRWLQATEAYSRALTLDPSNIPSRADFGASSCFYGAGTGDQSYVLRGLAETQRAAQASPADPRVQLSLGHCLISAQPPRTAEALASWRQVIQLAPADSPLADQARGLIAQYGK